MCTCVAQQQALLLNAAAKIGSSCALHVLKMNTQLTACGAQQQALLLNAAAEIGTGFMSVLALMAPPRSLLLPFMVWQILKMRYWSPDAATYHRQVSCTSRQHASGGLEGHFYTSGYDCLCHEIWGDMPN